MNKFIKEVSVTVSEIKLTEKSIPIMNVVIAGTPNLGDIITLMNNIKDEIKKINGEYISVTDLSRLEINKFLEKLILHGMESTYKSILSVGMPASISFVLLDPTQKDSDSLTEVLDTINKNTTSSNNDYKYRYIFINSRNEIEQIASKILCK